MLCSENALPILGNLAKPDREPGVFHLPAMREDLLAELVRRLSVEAGVVELNRHTKSLEEIFLSLTGEESK